MFQSFETFAEPARAPQRVKRVRALIMETGIDALLVPRADEH